MSNREKMVMVLTFWFGILGYKGAYMGNIYQNREIQE